MSPTTPAMPGLTTVRFTRAPTGPVLSPDDPRYGRPAGPPPVIYADRPPAGARRSPIRTAATTAFPAAGIVNSNDDFAASARGDRCADQRHRHGAAAAAASRRRWQAAGALGAAAGRTAGSRTGATAAASAPAGSRLRHQGARGHPGRRYAQHLPLLRARRRTCDPLRRARRPRRFHLDWRAEDHQEGRVAGLASADRDDRAPALSAALHGRRPRQSARRARDVSRLDHLPHPRHQPALDDRQVRLVRLHRHAERGRLRPVRAHQGRHPRGGDARRPAAGNRDRFRRAAARWSCRRRASAGASPGRAFPVPRRPWCRRCRPPRRSADRTHAQNSARSRRERAFSCRAANREADGWLMLNI